MVVGQLFPCACATGCQPCRQARRSPRYMPAGRTRRLARPGSPRCNCGRCHDRACDDLGGADHRGLPRPSGQRRRAAGEEAGCAQPGAHRPGVRAHACCRASTRGCRQTSRTPVSRSPRTSRRAAPAPGLFSIAIESAGVTDATGPAIPQSLRLVVQRGNLAVQYAPVRPRRRTPGWCAGLIVGEPVPARSGLFELYYLFPLTAEEQTIALVQRTVLLAGVALVAAGPGHRAARHPAGGAAGAGGRADRRPARGRGPVPAHPGARHRRHRPGWAARSTTWPAACSARSAGSRTCPGCSGGSPATSRTSCAPR